MFANATFPEHGAGILWQVLQVKHLHCQYQYRGGSLLMLSFRCCPLARLTKGTSCVSAADILAGADDCMMRWMTTGLTHVRTHLLLKTATMQV